MTTWGECNACLTPAILRDGLCTDCLLAEHDGRSWAVAVAIVVFVVAAGAACFSVAF